MPKVIVFCIDALCSTDIEKMKLMPNFSKILSNGCVVKKVLPVFPALTYTCHTSILTGTFAKKHGIIHNEKLSRGAKSGADWFTMKSDVKDKTLLDVAKENNLSTCSLSWPVSAGANYDMNMPMIVPYNYHGYEPEKWLAKTATENLMQKYFKKHGRFLKGRDRSIDLFTMALALDILEDFKQPDIMLVKMCDLDSARHTYGVYSEKAYEQLRKHDEELGAIMDCIEKNGNTHNTNFVVVGDHGQTDINDIFLINNLLKQHGFIKTDESGNVISYDAFCHSTGLAAFVEISEPKNNDLKERVYLFLKSLENEKDIKLNLILNEQQAKEKFGISGPFDFVIESELPIAFGESTKGDELWANLIPGDKKSGLATHGGSPSREEVTTFIASGPSVKPNIIIESCNMVDLAPTMAQMLGFKMQNIDGKALSTILK